MNSDYSAAMRRATESMRALNPQQATSIIQQALGVLPAWTPPAGSTGLSEDGPLTIDLEADQIEVVDPTSPSPRMRRPLGEVMQSLREGKLTAGFGGLPGGLSIPGRQTVLPELPQGAQFEWHSFSCAAGSRNYRLYVPACAPDAIRGLVIMLHGCKQHPDDFAAGTGMNALAETHRLLVAYPGQDSGANVSACWNWFDPSHQRRDSGEPAIIAGITREIVARFAVAPDRVFVAGLSAGGAMAAVMAATWPELYAAAGIHSGLAYGSANDVMTAFAAMRGERPNMAGRNTGKAAQPRLILFHGSADRTVAPANAAAIVEAARAALPQDPTVTRQTVDAGGRRCDVSRIGTGDRTSVELWMIEGAGHAWSGGRPAGSYTDPAGPDASAAMVDFFLMNTERT